jgi:hypothetical protein
LPFRLFAAADDRRKRQAGARELFGRIQSEGEPLRRAARD